MKPGAAWREEPWWHWGYPYANEHPLMPGSGVQPLGGADDAKPGAAANLWVPDPEARRGWREYYVYPDPSAPERRKLGL